MNTFAHAGTEQGATGSGLTTFLTILAVTIAILGFLVLSTWAMKHLGLVTIPINDNEEEE